MTATDSPQTTGHHISNQRMPSMIFSVFDQSLSVLNPYLNDYNNLNADCIISLPQFLSGSVIMIL